MKNQQLYSVGAAAREAGPISPSSLRRLDDIVQPLRTETGTRIYTAQHVAIARAIVQTKNGA